MVAGGAPGSVAVGDVDRDGNPNLAVAKYGWDRVSVLSRTGNGAFGRPFDYTVGDAPTSVAIGDLDRVGNPDLAVANYISDDVSVLLGQ